MPIHVNASYRGLTARTSITQFSVLPPGAKASSGGGSHRGLITVLVVLGAAAAGGGAYFATHKNPNSGTVAVAAAAVAPIGIVPGTGTIIGGH
jgi:hypothetical protein